MKRNAKTSARVDYNANLEAYYQELLFQQRAGSISPTMHQTLETFLSELRDLVAETSGAKMPKAA